MSLLSGFFSQGHVLLVYFFFSLNHLMVSCLFICLVVCLYVCLFLVVVEYTVLESYNVVSQEIRFFPFPRVCCFFFSSLFSFFFLIAVFHYLCSHTSAWYVNIRSSQVFYEFMPFPSIFVTFWIPLYMWLFYNTSIVKYLASKRRKWEK